MFTGTVLQDTFERTVSGMVEDALPDRMFSIHRLTDGAGCDVWIHPGTHISLRLDPIEPDFAAALNNLRARLFAMKPRKGRIRWRPVMRLCE